MNVSAKLPRDIDRASWRRFYRHLRRHGIAADAGVRPGGDPIAENARTVARIAALAEYGLVGLSVTQMDCDCSQWSTLEAIPAQRVYLERELQRIYENAEGPVSWGLCEPPARPEYHSRDLALEAFEDGHPHVVYA
jgi:hypothetical protein